MLIIMIGSREAQAFDFKLMEQQIVLRIYNYRKIILIYLKNLENKIMNNQNLNELK